MDKTATHALETAAQELREPVRGFMVEVRVTQFVTRFLFDDAGATAIEYGLIAGGIAVAIVSAITALSGSVKGDYDAVAAATEH